MKKTLKKTCGLVAVVAAVCALSTAAQARVFVNVGFGFPIYGPAYYSAPAYYGPAYCGPSPYYSYSYYRPAYRYYCAPPRYYYSGGAYYRCR